MSNENREEDKNDSLVEAQRIESEGYMIIEENILREVENKSVTGMLP